MCLQKFLTRTTVICEIIFSIVSFNEMYLNTINSESFTHVFHFLKKHLGLDFYMLPIENLVAKSSEQNRQFINWKDWKNSVILKVK